MEVSALIGKYPAKLDEKNRLFVPAKLRAELGEDFYVTLGVNCGHSCLTVYTAEDWQTKTFSKWCSSFKSSTVELWM